MITLKLVITLKSKIMGFGRKVQKSVISMLEEVVSFNFFLW